MPESAQLSFESIFLLFLFYQYVPMQIYIPKAFTGTFLLFKLQNDFTWEFCATKFLFM